MKSEYLWPSQWHAFDVFYSGCWAGPNLYSQASFLLILITRLLLSLGEELWRGTANFSVCFQSDNVFQNWCYPIQVQRMAMPCPGWALGLRSNLCFRKPRLFRAKASGDALVVYCILLQGLTQKWEVAFCDHSILTGACYVCPAHRQAPGTTERLEEG